MMLITWADIAPELWWQAYRLHLSLKAADTAASTVVATHRWRVWKMERDL